MPGKGDSLASREGQEECPLDEVEKPPDQEGSGED